MKKVIKIVLLSLAIGFICIQFVRPKKNLTLEPNPNDLIIRYEAPSEIKQILVTSCYDCHSNHTRYPWYAEIQPVGLWLAHHVKEGKAELNFSDFANYSNKRAKQKLKECIEEVEEGHMPLPSYLWVHREARLTSSQVSTLTGWFEEMLENLDHEE